jgi:hypothetical protein
MGERITSPFWNSIDLILHILQKLESFSIGTSFLLISRLIILSILKKEDKATNVRRKNTKTRRRTRKIVNYVYY